MDRYEEKLKLAGIKLKARCTERKGKDGGAGEEGGDVVASGVGRR